VWVAELVVEWVVESALGPRYSRILILLHIPVEYSL